MRTVWLYLYLLAMLLGILAGLLLARYSYSNSVPQQVPVTQPQEEGV